MGTVSDTILDKSIKSYASWDSRKIEEELKNKSKNINEICTQVSEAMSMSQKVVSDDFKALHWKDADEVKTTSKD